MLAPAGWPAADASREGAPSIVASDSGESQSPGPGAGGPALTPGTRYVVSLRRIDENGIVTVAGERPFDHQPEP